MSEAIHTDADAPRFAVMTNSELQAELMKHPGDVLVSFHGEGGDYASVSYHAKVYTTDDGEPVPGLVIWAQDLDDSQALSTRVQGCANRLNAFLDDTRVGEIDDIAHIRLGGFGNDRPGAVNYMRGLVEGVSIAGLLTPSQRDEAMKIIDWLEFGE